MMGIFRLIKISLLTLSLFLAIPAKAANDVCNNLELRINNQLGYYYELEIRNITYKSGRGDNSLYPGSKITFNQSLSETMYSGETFFGLLHGIIHAKVLINIRDLQAENKPLVDTLELNIYAQGSGKVKGTCLIETHYNNQMFELPSGHKALLTIETQSLAYPKVKVTFWRLAKTQASQPTTSALAIKEEAPSVLTLL